jgi:hypothetical protein
VLEMNITGMVIGILPGPRPSEHELEQMKRQVVEAALGGLLAYAAAEA